MPETFVIIDGNSLMHRAFHALPPLASMASAPPVPTPATHKIQDKSTAINQICSIFPLFSIIGTPSHTFI